MARWKALPDELDPQMREFVLRLRVLVDHAGLSIAAVADRTGYSRASWGRYLGGTLLAPKGAVVALAEVTGTPPQHLAALWEPAERAWSRSEARHRMTMEVIGAARARTAHENAGEPPRAPVAGAAPGGTAVPFAADQVNGGRGTVRSSPPPASGAAPRATRAVPGQRAPAAGPAPDAGSGGDAAGPRRARGQPRRRPVLPAAMLAGVLLLAVGVTLAYDRGGDTGARPSTGAPPPGPATSGPRAASGAGCAGAGCTGLDPEAMGCGRSASTVASAAVGSGLVEVRYSRACGAAWARITRASAGDTVRIAAGRIRQDGAVGAEAAARTPMVAVEKASEAEACATLVSGVTGCTAPE
ncbi:DUF2690 domain-containing protein [Streptomyces sp. NPDC059166]|uniref:helix-turn-helix domain-containing protein n=1 Tax=Streptomyces sp. NPDC059166 TaxID=3346752 RepID=UPI0036BB2A42